MVLGLVRYALPLVALTAGCLKHTPPAPPKAEPVTAVLVNESASGSPVSAPLELTRDMTQELAAKGFRVSKWIDSSTLGTEFEQRRSTQGRLRFLARQRIGDGELVLLVETRSRFFSELEGRFRWVVDTRASFADRRDISKPVTASFSAPAILNFPHQGGTDALRYVSGPVAREVGLLAARYRDEEAGASSPSAAPSDDDQTPSTDSEGTSSEPDQGAESDPVDTLPDSPSTDSTSPTSDDS